MVNDLRAKDPTLRVVALGGPALRDAGAQLLLDMTSFSAVGLVEVLTAFDKLVADAPRYKPG